MRFRTFAGSFAATSYSLNPLLAQYGRHEIALGIVLRSIGQCGGSIERRANLVGPKDILHSHRVGHRLDLIGVKFAELFDVADNLAELRRHAVQFIGLQQQPPEQRDLFHFLAGKRHEVKADLQKMRLRNLRL